MKGLYARRTEPQIATDSHGPENRQIKVTNPASTTPFTFVGTLGYYMGSATWRVARDDRNA